ncbi:MAG: UbiX family flavin prenyltransferase [Magnetococcus sp. DMHC-6]
MNTEPVLIGGDPLQNSPITVAMTGASGAWYGLRLLEGLLAARQRIDLLISDAALTVLEHECRLGWMTTDLARRQEQILSYFMVGEDKIRHYGNTDWFAPMATGSGKVSKMVICPCSMGTLAAIAHGLSDNLIERAADVVIKERGQLIIVPRETPFSAIHLENMLTLAKLGVTILPACPGFYQGPETIRDLVDFIVARILSQLGIRHGIIVSGQNSFAKGWERG